MTKFVGKPKAKRFWARYNGDLHFFVEVEAKPDPDWITHCGIRMSLRPLEIKAQRKCVTCESIEARQADEGAKLPSQSAGGL